MKKTLLTFACLIALLSSAAFAQAVNPALRPPKGAQVAIVVFEDLQCPDCRRAAPLLEEAAKTYKIPIVRHDYPLPMHNWSYDAAVIAKYFDSKAKALGSAWRDYCFENQSAISPENLRSNAEKFAAQNKASLPFVVDPDGKFAAEVKADFALGQRVGIEHTPTIYVVSNKTYGKPFVEVVDRRNLYSQIDEMIAEAGGTTKPLPGKKRAAAKPSPGAGR